MPYFENISSAVPNLLFAFYWSDRNFLRKVLDAWSDDAVEFVHSKLPRLVVVAIGAWLLIKLLRLITRYVVRVAERNAEHPKNVSQLKTLASAVRGTGIVIISALAAMYILPILGVDLGPLLASAGVAGVALGLAAQTIVKDVLNGILLLMEDQFNVGDVVTVAGLTGVVESLTLRRTTLRGFDGTVYVIPNSQITSTANQSREFSLTTLQISVDFSADPDKVTALLSGIVQNVRNDPAYASAFLADPQVLGVDSIKGSEVIYPIAIRTKPRQQFAALREMQRRIRLALEENNMLPGSPYRVLQGSTSMKSAQPKPGTAITEAGLAAAETPAAQPEASPTARPSTDVNPFNPQS